MLYRYMRRNLGADPKDAAALASDLNIMEATAEILIGRGFATAEAARAFFEPGLDRLRDPMGLVGMDEAVTRIENAIRNHERITVYGDYDVDGVCATSILIEYLMGRGADCGYYIPNRHTEGYGMNRRAVESLVGTGLLITVDCGITNAAEVALARALGMDVIVTDHHECPETLPDCAAVVNPKRPGQAYGFSGLCGAGTALKLVQAMGGLQAVEQALDLAALATVADIVPLTDENRSIVRMGIERINGSPRPGIQALKEAAGMESKPVKAGSIGFVLAPRINAGGRMDLSRKSVELMLTQDMTKAREIANELNDDNAARVKTEDGILREAVELVEGGYSFAGRRAIVLYRPHWNTGVTGIVASRIVERYHRPTILFGDGEGSCYGSGRSVPGVHLYNALKACSDWFTRFGGHEQAAGCALLPEHVELFASALDRYLMENYAEDVFLPLRQYDAELPLAGMTLGLAHDMDRLEPCGFGNPRPVFLFRDVEMAGLSRTNDGKHLRMRFGSREGVEGIAFRQGDAYDTLAGSRACDALAVPDVNDWMGRRRVQAIVEHIRPPQGMAYARVQLNAARAGLSRALLRAVAGQGGEDAATLGYIQGLEAFLNAVKRSCWGTAALCYTASGAEALLKALHESGLLDRIYVGAGCAPQATRRENSLIIAPDPERLNVSGYDAVFVFDGLLAGGEASWIMSRLNNPKNCIIITGNAENAQAGQFTREALLGVWRAMKLRLSAGAGPSGPTGWDWLSDLDAIGPWRAEVSARVFLELGLLLELDRLPWLAFTEPQPKADLNDSRIFRWLTESNRRRADEPEGQGAGDTGLSNARHTLPGHHDAAEGRRGVRGAAGQDA